MEYALSIVIVLNAIAKYLLLGPVNVIHASVEPRSFIFISRFNLTLRKEASTVVGDHDGDGEETIPLSL